MNLGETLRELRLDKGLTQKEVGTMIYVTAQAVSRWENNESEPNIQTLRDLATLYGVPLSRLLPDNDQKEVNSDPLPATDKWCSKCKKPLYEHDKFVTRANQYGVYEHTCLACLRKEQPQRRASSTQPIPSSPQRTATAPKSYSSRRRIFKPMSVDRVCGTIGLVSVCIGAVLMLISWVIPIPNKAILHLTIWDIVLCLVGVLLGAIFRRYNKPAKVSFYLGLSIIITTIIFLVIASIMVRGNLF